MSQKNETPVLLLSLIITLGLLGGGFWWFTRNSRLNVDQILKGGNNSKPSANQSPAKTKDTFAQLSNIPSGLFNYGGSTSWAPIRLAVDSAIQVARPEFRLRYVQPIGAAASSGTGIKMLLDGRLSFAQSSRSLLDQEYQQAQKRGFSLEQIPVAIDGLAVAVNPNLNIPGLTLDQLKSIYTGKITNWQQVGGANIPIKPFSRPVNAGGTVELFVEEILKGEKFSSQVVFIPTTTQALSKVASNIGGIYFASAPEVVPQCTIKPLPLGSQEGKFIPPYQEPFVPLSECPGKRNQLNIAAFQNAEYPITRNLFVVVKENGQVDEQAGKAYANLLLTEQGQELINQSGFVRIR